MNPDPAHMKPLSQLSQKLTKTTLNEAEATGVKYSILKGEINFSV